jgi:hypothetical protein
MASLESLPPDQRAVLQLVLQRGRTYDQIADMLSIDRAAVRQRALQALDAIGPQTRVAPERRAIITDYLLGQLPERVSADTRDRLAESASERAWARVIASELSPLSSKPLPEIPVDGGAREPAPEPVAEGSAIPPAAPVPPAATESPEPAAAERTTRRRAAAAGAAAGPPSSRRGGAILLGIVALVVVAAVVIVIVTSGGSSKKNTSSAVASTPSTTSATTSTATTSGATTAQPQIVAQVNLNSPTKASTKGVAEVFKRGTTVGVLIAAQNVPPNTKHDAYAVWLFNSPSDSHILGFVNPGVGSNGRLSTAGALPTNAGHFKQLLVTRETARNPTQPGTIILQGALTGLS